MAHETKLYKEKETLRFVMVGHVDHGKSTLIGRLLYDTNSLTVGRLEEIKKVCEQLGKEFEFAYVMDHLEEERSQAVTIDTAQTFFSTDERDYVIIDAPGHREFVKNMVTGASQAEAAVIIVDATEGVAEQTRRHAYILSMLNLKQVVAVINKMDLAEYRQDRFESVMRELLQFLGTIGIEPLHVIPISAKEGDNVAKRSGRMGWYGGPTLLEALGAIAPATRLVDRPFRMVVQDVYDCNYKRLVVGRVESGQVSVGEGVVVLPSGERGRVRTIETYLKPQKGAESGQSIGVRLERASAQRGDVLATPDDQPALMEVINAHIFWLDEKPLEKKEKLVFRCATQERKCRIAKIKRVYDSSTLEVLRDDTDRILPTEVADVEIHPAGTVVMEEFGKVPSLGRFVLEREGGICAGGVLTDIGRRGR